MTKWQLMMVIVIQEEKIHTITFALVLILQTPAFAAL